MRISPFAAAALILAFVALVLASISAPAQPSLAIGVIAAAVVVVMAMLFQYAGGPPTEVQKIPIEDFNLWAEVKAPVAGIRGLKPREKRLALSIASTDLSLLALNAELLGSRLSLLAGRHGFDKLTRDRLHKEGEGFAKELRRIADEAGLPQSWSYERMKTVLEKIERCASSYDRIANKLYEYGRERPEVVRAALGPLRRASEKLSTDLRTSYSNLENYVKSAKPSKA